MYIPILKGWLACTIEKIETFIAQGAKCVAIAFEHPTLGTVAISSEGVIRQGDLREELHRVPDGEFKIGEPLIGTYGFSVYDCTIIVKDDKYTAVEWQMKGYKTRTIDKHEDLKYYKLMRVPAVFKKTPWWKKEYFL